MVTSSLVFLLITKKSTRQLKTKSFPSKVIIMINVVDMKLKEIFKYVAIKENSIYNTEIPNCAKNISTEIIESYFTVTERGKDIKAAKVDSIVFVPTKRTSQYWEGRMFKLIYNIIDNNEKRASRTIGWSWSPNGGSDIYDDKRGLFNNRLDCIQAGLMRRVYYDNYEERNGNRLYLYLVWIDGKFIGTKLLPEL